ncbi:universal stress protein [Zavarzinia sp.]|uniref:universal stress protein n=1 Tax=Zavarzinia sp. TaxID=2027920 RepID=UPI0035650CC5
MFRHILLSTDGSPLANGAVDKGLDLARETGAQVTVVTAAEPFHLFWADSDEIGRSKAEHDRRAREEAAGILAEVEAKAKAAGVACHTVLAEGQEPYRAIIDVAGRAGCDLIAMASHGRRGVAAVLLGSQTTKVLTHSSLPVLVYR